MGYFILILIGVVLAVVGFTSSNSSRLIMLIGGAMLGFGITGLLEI